MAFDHILILALIQGVTEFIPVSSSGHLTLAHGLTALPDHGVAMDVALHFGTLLAVMVYFRADVMRLMSGLVHLPLRRQTQQARAATHMIYATLPVLIAAALMLASGMVESLRSAQLVAWASIIFAVPLYLADRFAPAEKTVSDMADRPAMLMGLAQILALIPGASRAGVTIMAGRALGFSREAAARYSMLMAMPVIAAFALVGLLQLISAAAWGALGQAALGALLAAIFAFITIDLFLRLTRRMSLLFFVAYRIALGATILVFF
jgi:undecaprenyl-diphosphatase